MKDMTTQEEQGTTNKETREQAIGKRIDAIGWALFFIMIGGIGLAPKESIPEGTWLIGVGLIMLGNNAVRYLSGLKMINFTMLLGLLALGIGISVMFGIDLPVFPILLILVGVSIIIGPLLK